MSELYTIDDLDPAWCSWFSGFVDGEGYFQIYIGKDETHHKVQISFAIQIREDDAEVIHEIHQVLKCGNFYHVNNDCTRRVQILGSDVVRWRVAAIQDIIQTLIPLFDRYPLKTKKAYDFFVWRQASLMFLQGRHRTPDGFLELKCLGNLLKEKRIGPYERYTRSLE